MRDGYMPSQQQLLQEELLFKILQQADAQHIRVIVVGGYGLDALYGQVTRDHKDFDLYVPQKDKSQFATILNDLGFRPTGKSIGTVGKAEYEDPHFSKDFHIEVGIIENGLKLVSERDRRYMFPDKPLGSLSGHPIHTPSLFGFKKIIEINNTLQRKNNDPEYSHKEWMNDILQELGKKYQ